MIHNSFPSMKPNIDKNFGEGNSMMGSYGWWHFQVLNAASGWNSHGVEQLCLHLLPAHGYIQVRTQSARSVWSACRSGEKGLGMAALLATYGTLFTILYLAWPHPILHQVHHNILFEFKSLFICRWCMGCWCSTWFTKLWWYSKKDSTKSAWSE